MSHTVRQSVGSSEVVILLDGGTEFGTEMFSGDGVENIDALLHSADKAAIETCFNAVLIRSDDAVTLIDAGARDVMGPSAGRLPEALAEANVSPEDVNLLVITHLHPDHIAGTLSQDGAAVFANAEVVVPGKERAFWIDDGNFASVDETGAFFRELALTVLNTYDDNLKLVEQDADLGGGLSLIDMPGHTPGHVGLRLESEGEQFLYFSDLLHAPDLQFANPALSIVFDNDPHQAIQTRKAVLDMLATEQTLCSGGHLLRDNAVGNVERFGNGYRFVT